MKVLDWTDDRIAAEARALLANPVLAQLLTNMDASASNRVASQSTGDDLALRIAACELKAVRSVRGQLAEIARKDQ
jgi:hypothetical protein